MCVPREMSVYEAVCTRDVGNFPQFWENSRCGWQRCLVFDELVPAADCADDLRDRLSSRYRAMSVLDRVALQVEELSGIRVMQEVMRFVNDDPMRFSGDIRREGNADNCRDNQ